MQEHDDDLQTIAQILTAQRSGPVVEASCFQSPDRLIVWWLEDTDEPIAPIRHLVAVVSRHDAGFSVALDAAATVQLHDKTVDEVCARVRTRMTALSGKPC